MPDEVYPWVTTRPSGSLGLAASPFRIELAGFAVHETLLIGPLQLDESLDLRLRLVDDRGRLNVRHSSNRTKAAFPGQRTIAGRLGPNWRVRDQRSTYFKEKPTWKQPGRPFLFQGRSDGRMIRPPPGRNEKCVQTV